MSTEPGAAQKRWQILKVRCAEQVRLFKRLTIFLAANPLEQEIERAACIKIRDGQTCGFDPFERFGWAFKADYLAKNSTSGLRCVQLSQCHDGFAGISFRCRQKSIIK